MAVSGRKIAGFEGSISRGSAEDFDHRCEPCLAICQLIEAGGFCIDCHEYLCKNCYSYHQRTKASKHHQLVDKDNMDKHADIKKGSEECTEKCQVHKKEVIKFFCPVHEALGCNDCITLNHRTCDIDYIPDKCAGIGDSDEYREVMGELDEKVNEAEDIIKLAASREKEIDMCHDRLLKEIMKFRKEINDRLDQLQNQILTDAGKKKSTDKQTVQKVLETGTNVAADIKQLQSRLQDSKTSKQNGQLYITLKQAQAKLNAGEIMEAEKSLEQTDAQYTFEPNQDIEDLFSSQNSLGKLSLSTSLVTSKRMKTIDKLTHKEDINIRTKSDKSECNIRGCVMLSSSKLMLADYNNNKLIVVDTQSKAVVGEKSLHSKPWDITALPQNQIAVTMPDQREILIMSTAGKMPVIRKIPVQGKCRGITYHQGQLYIVCWDPKCVYIIMIIDTQGNVQKTISLDNDRFVSPNNILLSENLTHIYISNYDSNSVVSITLQGDISAEYKNADFKEPVGMLMLEDGSLLVCCSMRNGCIYRISGDLKKGQTMIENLKDPWSLCYNRHKDEIYIGLNSDQLKVFIAK